MLLEATLDIYLNYINVLTRESHRQNAHGRTIVVQ